MNEKVDANIVIKFLQEALSDKDLEVAILKAQLEDAKASLAKASTPADPQNTGDNQQ